jgi:subtilisin family serine protease
VRAFLAAGIAVMSTGAFASQKIQNFDEEFIPGELIVKFAPHFDKSAVEKFVKDNDGVVLKQFRSSGAMHVALNTIQSIAATKAAAEKFAQSADVEYVEANNVIRLENTPDDPQLGSLWGMEKISAEAAWEVSTGSRDVVVAVIDTGVDYNHPDLRDNYWYNPGETGTDEDGRDKSTNGIDDDGNGYVDDFRGWDFANNDNNPMDDHDHGTHCAGTIGATGNNGTGVAGVNWTASVVGLKFISASGSGSTTAAISAIEYATKLGVTLTSNSWGGGGSSTAMLAAIREANDAGILFVAAAGNSTSNNDSRPNYPSNYDVDNVIAVAATQQNDTLASFSSYGRTTVDLAAPGVSILSTTRNGGFKNMSGTSMATPHVAGAVALIKSAFPAMTGAELKDKLLSTVDPVSSLTTKVATGGRLNIEKALQP